MGTSRASQRRRKATLVAFCLVALSSVAAQQGADQVSIHDGHSQPTEGSASGGSTQNHASEASSAYNEALHALQSLQPPPKQAQSYSSQTARSSLLSLFPNAQGPISSVLRIANRIRNHGWLPRWLSGKMDRINKDDATSSWSVFGSSGSPPDPGSSKALKVIDLLTHAADLGHLDAMYSLADLSLFPPTWFSLPINATRAFKYYSTHADITGNATSQSHVAFFYATGYAPEGQTAPVQVDQARALLYYTFAAHGGDTGSSMVLGYRNWAGIGTNENCMAALDWYESAAEAAMAHFITGPPGGHTLPKSATKISDLDGGVFGPGASVASTGGNVNRPVIKAAKSRGTGETWDDLIGFYKFHADRDELDYAYRLGKIYYQGSIYNAPGGIASGAESFGAIPQDFLRAKAYFLKVARQVWPAQPINGMSRKAHLTKKEGVDEHTIVTGSWAAGYLGRMYLRGEGVKQDFKVARIWFERGAEYNEKESLNGLGIIWRDGLLNKEVDVKLANEYFLAAASQDFAEAQVNLGKFHYHRAEFAVAIKYFEAAIRNGSRFEAFYYIASIHAARALDPSSSSSVSAGSCGVAVSFFKLVAERGSWKSDLIGEAERLWLGGDNGFALTSALIAPSSSTGMGDERSRERDAAKLRWWIAAEQGHEIAQNNLAYTLDPHKSLLDHYSSTVANNETARSALIQWTRSAAQHDVDALVKVGDYYYWGVGIENESQDMLWEKAAGYYLSAVETQRSALAMWNLGWMYESGRGVSMDYHLAKRYYDMALETNTEAYLPVMLSLSKLYLKSLWYTITNGQDKSLLLWNVDDDEQWYIGKAREEFAKRWQKGAGSPEAVDGGSEPATIDADDPVEWAEEQKAAEVERARAEEEAYERGDFFSGDFLAVGDPRRPPRYDENGHEMPDVQEFWETMFLAALVIMISALIFVRARFVAQADVARRRYHEQQEQERRNADGTTPAAHEPERRDDPDAIPDIGLFAPGQEPPDL
ncbi:HCP-like protein [Clavulina sp. PMI_390]|nr:HCP-like protein [Clavulina sp. PMI_390]